VLVLRRPYAVPLRGGRKVHWLRLVSGSLPVLPTGCTVTRVRRDGSRAGACSLRGVVEKRARR